MDGGVRGGERERRQRVSVIRIHYTQEIYLKVNCKSINLTKNLKKLFLKSVSFVNNRIFWLLQNGSFAVSHQKQSIFL